MDMRQLVRAFDAGRVDADTLVWRKGMPDWRRLRDISELAERLVGAAGDASEKKASEPPPADLAQSSSEPPPRQSERSRTPPASYTVGSRSGSEPPLALEGAQDGAMVQNGATSHSSASHGSVSAGLAANGALTESRAAAQGGASFSSVPPAVAGSERTSLSPAADDDGGSPPPSRRSTPSGSPRPHSRRGRGKTPSRPNASLSPVPSRTVTQTGLESPAEVTARSSVAPPPGAGSGSEGPPARTRDSRTSDSRTSAAPPGPRRQASSDETPAQKPSSLSVPPGAMIDSQSRPRGRRFLAIAAVVLGAAFLLKQVATSGDGLPATAAHRVDAVPAEKPVAPERKAASGQPLPGVPNHGSLPSAGQAAGEPGPAVPLQSPGARTGDVASGPSKATATTPATLPGAVLPSPVAPASSSALNVEASARETVGPVGAARSITEAPVADAPRVPAREAPLAAPPAVPAPAPRPSPAPAAAPALAAKPPPPAPKPPAPAEPAPAPVAREPRPFDEALATQQFQAAVAKASACGQQGATRGTGRVKVAIEPWGRVGRVTHLNQDFAGTPVGVCVMEVFQQIRVPPFDGNSRSIAGEFVVE